MTRSPLLDDQTRITSVREMTTPAGPPRDAFLVQVRGPDLGRRLVLSTNVEIGRAHV